MTPNPRESELLEKAVAGDRVALQQLFASHASRIARFADKRLPASVRDLIDPEDIVQQTFTDAFRCLERFRGQYGVSFPGWLTGIAKNKINDAIKGLRREKRGGSRHRVRKLVVTESQSVVELVALISGGHTPSFSVKREEAILAIHDAIDALPDQYRAAVQLRCLEGKSLEETAAIMQCSPRAVQGLVDRAKKKLRATLGRLSKYE